MKFPYLSEKNEIAEGFHVYPIKIGTKTSNNVSTTNKKFSSYMPPPQLHSIVFEQVSSHDSSSAIYKLKPKTSVEHGISTKIMKETIENILEPITHIINCIIAK